MTSNALKKLASSDKHYDLSVDAVGSGKAGEVAVKAILTLFTPGVDGKPGVTDRRVSIIATGTDMKEVKLEAIQDVLAAVGIYEQ